MIYFRECKTVEEVKVRLDQNAFNQPENTEFQPRQIWEIDFVERSNTTPPHVEDILVKSKELKGTLKNGFKIKDFIEEKKIPIWTGSPDNMFDGLLNWTASGSGYIDKKGGIPAHSVGFWLSDKNLTKNEFKGIRYNYPSERNWRSLKFKGFEDPVDIIPKGTLLRVSLARWVSLQTGEDPKCWLQLSGWYDL